METTATARRPGGARRPDFAGAWRVAETERLSSERVMLPAGTLYGALDRLLKAGLVVGDGQEIVDGRARRYYALTETGARELREEAERLQQAARAILKPARASALLGSLGDARQSAMA